MDLSLPLSFLPAFCVLKQKPTAYFLRLNPILALRIPELDLT